MSVTQAERDKVLKFINVPSSQTEAAVLQVLAFPEIMLLLHMHPSSCTVVLRNVVGGKKNLAAPNSNKPTSCCNMVNLKTRHLIGNWTFFTC